MQTVLPSDEHLKEKLFHKETVLVSEDQKYPQLFRWKTATLIIGAITAILFMILLIVVYNIQSQQQIITNLTFLSIITQNTHILTNKNDIINLSRNFQSIYGTTKFPHSELLYRGTNFTTKVIKENIYWKKNQKIVYLFELQLKENENQHSIRFAAFMNSPFPVPQGDDFNGKLDYYSFQISNYFLLYFLEDQRKSSLLSLNSNSTLKLYSTHPQVKSVSECQNYKFEPENKERTGSFSLLNNLVWFEFSSQAAKISTSGWKCFSPEFESEQAMQKTLQEILHPKYNDPTAKIEVVQIEVYHLS